jgi:hypothetical protein
MNVLSSGLPGVWGFPKSKKDVPMDRRELYLSYAADCQQMAYITRNEIERLSWLDMAQSWLNLAQAGDGAPQSRFEEKRRNAA